MTVNQFRFAMEPAEIRHGTKTINHENGSRQSIISNSRRTYGRIEDQDDGERHRDRSWQSILMKEEPDRGTGTPDQLSNSVENDDPLDVPNLPRRWRLSTR
ncbi:hypothetical protein L484_021967 [Morus notabilis]|uniref:Uncharacterized protein n=1 Tax=Morus notabilis TaxID=981085 RepID=W9QMD2_9ROSA|nr:hypothetical protein L484_021967 [Morus notabilis]